MSNRGNQDYFKIQGTPTEDRDITRAAHQRLAQDSHAARAGGRKSGRGRFGAVTGPLADFVRSQSARPERGPVRVVARVDKLPVEGASAPNPPVEMYGEAHAFSETEHRAPGWAPPSLGESAWIAAKGGYRLGVWAARQVAAMTWRRVERALDSGVERLTRGHRGGGQTA